MWFALTPDVVGGIQGAAPYILAAIGLALFLLVIDNWPEKPRKPRF